MLVLLNFQSTYSLQNTITVGTKNCVGMIVNNFCQSCLAFTQRASGKVEIFSKGHKKDDFVKLCGLI